MISVAREKNWTAVAATLMMMLLAGSMAFGESPTPCEVAYLTSGPTVQQPSLHSSCQLET